MAKLEDIMKLKGRDIIKLTKKEILELLPVATSVARKRISRLEEYLVKENQSTTTSYIGEQWFNDKTFSYNKKMTLNELRNVLATTRNFLDLKGSNITGQKKIVNNLITRLGLDKEKVNKDLIVKLWDIYNRVKNTAINKYMSSDQLQKEIYDIIVDSKEDSEKIAGRIMELSNESYRRGAIEDFDDDDGLDI